MKTKGCLSASILLMLSLGAALLVAGGPSDAAVGTIRLPSDAQGMIHGACGQSFNSQFRLLARQKT
jgi:hypothetical protein